MRWPDELGRPPRYARQIERLYARYGAKHRLERLVEEGVPFAEVVRDKRRVSELLARAVGDGTYAPGAARLARAYIKDRFRDLYRLSAFDFVVHGVVGEIITEAIEPALSPSLYSYRRRRSSWHAVRGFAAYLRRHRAERADPRARGLYVLRGDVRAYADSIPVDEASPLWAELRAALGLPADDARWRLVRALVRPEVLDEGGVAFMRARGLALGSPMGTPLMNLYLHNLDRELDALCGFYARFGDDLLFAHADPDVVRRAGETLDARLAERRLELNPKKRRLLFVNGAGRPSAAWPEARGTTRVVFLGCAASFDGTVSLPSAKVRAALIDLRRRLARTAAVLVDEPLEARARALVAITNETLDPRSLLARPEARLLRALATDRAQLAAVDHLVARMLVEAITGSGDARAMRRMPWRRLRELGLASLVALRNADPE
jgi:hypothetical protein